MAELIDKGALLEQYGLKDATKYGNKDAKQQAHSYSTLMLYEIADMISSMPTVTEADIRAKAISEFAKRVKHKIMSEIDECADELEWITEIEWQLKGEQ